MQDQHSLKPGTILERYKIIRILGEGGFGITYLAEDISLRLKVVIKEYFPNEFAMRSGESTIIAKSKSLDDFSKGLQRFKEEAQTLAKFNHPSIVKILTYFEANDTAYFIMEHEEGIDLSQYMKQKKEPFTQEEILSIMMPILEGLKEVHTYKYLHRDIKPGNILLRTNKSPVLIDFGASKLALGEASKSITSMLTEGYAPLEQYSTDIKQQGAFTDIYAVAAVMYKMITGKVPPSAQTRSYQLLSDGNDPLNLLKKMKLPLYTKSFLSAIDRALSIKGKDRPMNVQDFQADLAGELKIQKINDPKPKSKKLLFFIFFLLIIIGIGYYFFNVTSKTNELSKPSKKFNQTTEVLRAQKANAAKEEIDTEKIKEQERLEKEHKEITTLQEEKIKAQSEELKKLRKEKAEAEAAKRIAEKLAFEKKAAEKFAADELKKKEVERVKLEKEIASQKFPLTIDTTPANAKVQIINIKPIYYDGIKLRRGTYKIRVSKSGYKTVNFKVDPSIKQSHNIVLEHTKILFSRRVKKDLSRSCKVTIYKDGSVGVKLYGQYKQWKSLSNRDKNRCNSALQAAKKNSGVRTYSRTKSTSASECKVTIYKDGSVGVKLHGQYKQWKSLSRRDKNRCNSALQAAKRKRKNIW